MLRDFCMRVNTRRLRWAPRETPREAWAGLPFLFGGDASSRLPDDQIRGNQDQPESPFGQQRGGDQVDRDQLPNEIGRWALAPLLHPGEELAEDERIHSPEHEPEEELFVGRRGDVPQPGIRLPEEALPKDAQQRLAPDPGAV